MPISLRYDDPIMATALAVGAGTEQGQAIIDNIIYERTRQQAEEARVRADRQRFGDERVVDNGGRYDRPYVRQPRGGYGGTGQPTPYQEAQINIANDRLAFEREKEANRNAPKPEPQITPYQQESLDLQRRGVDRQEQDQKTKTMQEGRDFLFNTYKWWAEQKQKAARDKFDRSIKSSSKRREDAKLRISQEQLDLAKNKAEAPKIQPRQAAAAAVSAMSPAAIAKVLGPLIQPETTYLNDAGNPEPGPWRSESITLAQNIAKAIENMPFEVLPNGLPVYSLPQLMQRRNELESGGVPRSVILMLDRAIEGRSKKEMSGQAGTPVAASPDAEIDITPDQAEQVRMLRSQGYDFETALQRVLGAGGQ